MPLARGLSELEHDLRAGRATIEKGRQPGLEITIMKCNVGGMDRSGRIVLGVVLLLVGLLAPLELTWRIVVLVVAAIALATAIMRFCPANQMFGIDTCEMKDGDQPG